MTTETSQPYVPNATDAQPIAERLNNVSRECLRQVWAIRDTLQTEMTPAQMADARMRLTGFYSTLTSAFNKAEEMNTRKWIEVRPEYNSDTRATKAVEITDLGILAKKLKNELRAIEKMISSLKQRIEIAQGEARNQY